LLALLVIQGLGWGAYAGLQWLLDAGGLSAAESVMFGAMLAVTLAESDSQRKSLALALQRQREAAAKLDGELSAARDIQVGFLPARDTISDSRVDLDVVLEPAASVGGDLYDFFMLDDHRLFFLIGDVAGKGVPASLFMAVSKTLTKSVMMRHPPNMSEAIAQANTEIVRDNSQMLFVTVFAAVLDLRTGTVECCRAGHEAPLLVWPGGEVRRLECPGGPPVGMFDELKCPNVSYQLVPGEILCVFTDGVTEAMDPADEPYGAERTFACLSAHADGGPAGLLRALYDDVKSFAGAAPQSDDITILMLRWVPDGRTDPA
jgi:serine phosphatase RsbU (regulator of sigma subunit)